MEFSKDNIKHSIQLEAKSLVIISDEARYGWMHSIPGRKTDLINGLKITRERRISLTFRKIL